MKTRSSIAIVALAGLVLAGCARFGGHAKPAPGQIATVRGTVAYRERAALPPDAVVEVSLAEVTAAAAVPVIAETTLRAEGRQVPIPFELLYDAGRIERGRVYGIRASIKSAGAVLFATDTAQLVITKGHPTDVGLWLKRGISVPADSGNGIVGTGWRLEDLAGTRAADRIEATLEFPEAGKVVGNGSCNRFFGTVEIAGESMRFGPLASTKMSCPEPAGDQETRYLRALQAAERFSLVGSMLLIYGPPTEKPLRFIRK